MTLFPDAGFVASPRPDAAPGAARFAVAPASRLFDGHFDGAPILPGVAQFALVLEALARRDGGGARRLAGVRDVRFSKPIRPADVVDVVLEDRPQASEVRFEIRAQGVVASSGVLLMDGLAHA